MYSTVFMTYYISRFYIFYQLMYCRYFNYCITFTIIDSRLEAGMCLHGSDISSETTPVEAALVWTISKLLVYYS